MQVVAATRARESHIQFAKKLFLHAQTHARTLAGKHVARDRAVSEAPSLVPKMYDLIEAKALLPAGDDLKVAAATKREGNGAAALAAVFDVERPISATEEALSAAIAENRTKHLVQLGDTRSRKHDQEQTFRRRAILAESAQKNGIPETGAQWGTASRIQREQESKKGGKETHEESD